MTLSHARFLVREWAAEELKDFREHWYPAVAPMFRDYEPGYRAVPDAAAKAQRITQTGWAMHILPIRHRRVLKAAYLGGNPPNYGDLKRALQAFGRTWQAFDKFNEPTNSV